MSKMKQTLVLVSGRSLDAAHLSNLLQDNTSITNCVFCDSNAVDSFPESTFEKALCFIRESLEIFKLAALREILVPGAEAEFHGAEESISLRRNCLMSSFVILESDLEGVLKVKKPDWNVGAKSAVTSNTKWTVSPEDEILDDDEFLTEEDLKPPVLEGGKQPVKKACENCTCGRAEGKEPVKLTQEMLDNPVTSCGSCGLGDAYRCATCPYRGLPAFEPGKKIQLPEDFLVSDI